MEKPEDIELYPLHYRKSGQGEKVLLSFHGYGLSNQSWAVLDDALTDQYTILHLDLPYHGSSQERSLTGKELLRTIDLILAYESLPERFDVMGFSLGANYATSLIVQIPHRIGSALYLAPDGFQGFDFKRFLHKNFLGKRLKNAFVRSGGIVNGLLRLSGVLGIYPPKTVNYFLESIGTREKRALLMNRWAAVVALNTSSSALLQTLHTSDVKLTIIAGSNDSVIKIKDLRKFESNTVSIQTVEMGHNLMHKDLRPLVRSILLPQSSEQYDA